MKLPSLLHQFLRAKIPNVNFQRFTAKSVNDIAEMKTVSQPETSRSYSLFGLDEDDEEYAELFLEEDLQPNNEIAKVSKKNRLINAMDLVNQQNVAEWLINGIIPNRALIEIVGASSTFKSFLAIDILYRISCGLDYHGRKTKQGPVIYVIGEGKDGLSNRIKALHQELANEVKSTQIPFEILTMPSNLFVEHEIKLLANEIKELYNDGVAITIFDTLHRNCTGADENSEKDFAVILKNIERHLLPISKVVGWIHHTGIINDERGRGTSARFAAIDTQIIVKRNKDDNTVSLNCKKQKDFEPFDSQHFKMVPIIIDGCYDEYGEAISSLVPIKINTPIKNSKTYLKKEHLDLIESLRSVIQIKGSVLPVSKSNSENLSGNFVRISVWKDAAIADLSKNGVPDPKKEKDRIRKFFDRALPILVASGIIEIIEDFVCIGNNIEKTTLFD